MSTLDAKCFPVATELQSGGGEMSCVKSVPLPYPSNIGHSIATDIMQEIIDNALDIATSTIYRTANHQKISPDLVGDILEKMATNSKARNDPTAMLDEKMKQIINEMKCPKGVGDQNVPVDSEVTIPKRTTLERKNRLTNLVKNSKHILTKLVRNDDTDDENTKLKSSKSEESYEQLVRTIDFENIVESRKNKCLEVGGCSTAPAGSLHFPVECTMEVIALSDDDSSDKQKKKRGKKLGLKRRILRFFRKDNKPSSLNEANSDAKKSFN